MSPLPPDFLLAREAQLQTWFARQLQRLSLGAQRGRLRPVSGDASFRRYFRAELEGGSCILVDAPLPHEDCAAFVAVDQRLAQAGVNVPALLAWDLELGFMCLGDLGDALYWTQLEAARRDSAANPSATLLYHAAFSELLKIQAADASALPHYDAALLRREMQLFIDWFCQGLLQLQLQAGELVLLESVFDSLISSALAQPQGFVHRDYHSRNLMYRQAQAPGVIDFQDAVRGPLTYDLVSLLRDCYIAWPLPQVRQWLADYARMAQAAGVPLPSDPQVLQRDFDYMGMQRHLKVLGIFARLWLRDGKRAYLADLPLTLHYLRSVAALHPEFVALVDWLERRIVPALPQALQRVDGAVQP